MRDDLLKMRDMINDLLWNNRPWPEAVIFAVQSPCVHGIADHIDFVRCFATREEDDNDGALLSLAGAVARDINEYLGLGLEMKGGDSDA